MAERNSMSISIAELREAVARILDAVETKFGAVVDLAADHYWVLDPVESVDLTRQPRIMTGQLSEDIEETRGVLTREDDEIYAWHDLAHLVGIFVRLSALDSPSATDRGTHRS